MNRIRAKPRKNHLPCHVEHGAKRAFSKPFPYDSFRYSRTIVFDPYEQT